MDQIQTPGSADPARLKTLKKRVRRNVWIILAAVGIFAACLNNFDSMNEWADNVGNHIKYVGLKG